MCRRCVVQTAQPGVEEVPMLPGRARARPEQYRPSRGY